MTNLVKPQVFLIGYTGVDMEGMKAYLQATGQEQFLQELTRAELEGVSPAESLISFYAKLCYKSLVVGKNDNITRVRAVEKNIKGILASAHGSVLEHVQINFVVTNCSRVFTHELVRHRVGTAFCLAGDTVIYGGAKVNGSWDGVRKSWPIKQLFEWSQDPKRKGRLKLITVRCFDGEQFVPAKIKSVIKSGVKRIFRITLADGKVIRCSRWHQFLSICQGSKDWHAVEQLDAGDFLATNGVAAYQSVDWLSQKYLEEGLTQKEMALAAGVSEATIKKWLAKLSIQKPGGGRFCSGSEPWNKGESGYKLGPLTPEACEKIRRSKLGEKNPNYRGDEVGISGARRRARVLHPQQPCEECGDENGHRHHVDRNPWNNRKGNIEFLCNSCHQKRHYDEDGPTRCLTAKYVEIVSICEEGDEMTYDLEVDHPAHNFVANGIVTHNSQTSGRYCRITPGNLDLVMDPILDPVQENVLGATVRTEVDVYIMECRLGLRVPPPDHPGSRAGDCLDYDGSVVGFDPDPDAIRQMWVPNPDMDFGQKKKLTSAIRRIAPNGQANEIGFSANIRSLRHLIQVRTSRHAEWEIRVVFDKVYRICKEKWPLLFSDAREEVVDGLLEVSGMKMNPYEKALSDYSPEELIAEAQRQADAEREKKSPGSTTR